jgi:3-isopropylmalate dehydratase
LVAVALASTQLGLCKYPCIAVCTTLLTKSFNRNDFGIRCVIAPSFAEIFCNNTMQNGMLPLPLSAEDCKDLATDAEAGVRIAVDLEKQEVRREGKPPITFSVDPFRRHCLINGLDDIGLTLQRDEAIASFEQKRSALWSWLDGFGYQGQKIPIASTKTSKKTEW